MGVDLAREHWELRPPARGDAEQELAARLGLIDRPRGEGDDMGGGYDNMDPMDAGDVGGEEDAEEER